MKYPLSKSIAILAAATLICTVPLRADNNQGFGGGNQCEHGGHVSGQERLCQEVPFTLTADAPADAKGFAVLKAQNEEGTNSAKLKIETIGLVAGTYTVTTTSLSTGTQTVLGTFDAVTVGGSGGDDQDDHGDDGDDGDQDGDSQGTTVVVQHLGGGDDNDDDGGSLTNDTVGEVTFGGDEDDDGQAFPAGFNPLDIASVQITDATGVVMMTADFTNLGGTTSATFTAKVKVTPGPAAPLASGKAVASSKVRHHRLHQTFELAAKGLPASSTLNVRINGQVLGQVKTNHAGKTAMHHLPAGVVASKVVSLSLEDASGNVAAGIHF